MQQNLAFRQRLPKKTLREVSTNTKALSPLTVSTNNNNAVTPVNSVSTTNGRSTENSNYGSTEAYLKACRKAFPDYWFYFDNVDEKVAKSLQRKIQLLGGKHETFFSRKCTHVVTTRSFYEECPAKENGDIALSMLHGQRENDQENIQPTNNMSTFAEKELPVRKRIIAKDPSHQGIFDQAYQLNMDVWRLSKMITIVGALMNKPSANRPTPTRGQECDKLGKLLLEEKKYGVNTSHRHGHAPRPVYVTFNNYYAKVEDVTGVHSPILVREFPAPTNDPNLPENARSYPWPKLYIREDGRSPFTVPDSSQPSALHRQLPKQQDKKQTQQPPQHLIPSSQRHQQHQETMAAMPPPTAATNGHNNNTNLNCIPHNTFASQQDGRTTILQQQKYMNPPLDLENLPVMNESEDVLLQASADISQMTSRVPYSAITYASTTQPSMTQPSKSTTTTTTNQPITDDKQTTFRRSGALLYENVSRMDRRMISNQRVSQATQVKAHALASAAAAGTVAAASAALGDRVLATSSSMNALRPAVAAKAIHDQTERRKRDLARRLAKENTKYCENCVASYQDLDKHLQDESHLAFVRDKNNFKELDSVLASARRLRRH